MTNTLHIIAIWMHILGIALFVGPQFFLALAWVPASRQITDPVARVAAMRTVTRRFGWIGGAGLLLIFVAGSYLIGSWRDYYAIPDDVSFTTYRYGVIFIVKMMLLLVLLAITAVHTFMVGPRLLEKLEAQAHNGGVTDADIRSARKASMAFSMSGLLLVLVIMVLGVMMNTATFSIIER